MKALMDEDFIVCGYYLKSDHLISVILGQYDGDIITYQGHVVMGVSKHDFQAMKKQIKALKEMYPDFPEFEDTTWLMPKLVCTVSFMERTQKGGMRQPVFKGLRDDKTIRECKV